MILPALKWRPSPNFYADRTVAHSRLIVHDTEGGYAGAIATFANAHSEVSAHFVLKEDGSEITQMVPLTRIAWHVKAFNAGTLVTDASGNVTASSDARLKGIPEAIATGPDGYLTLAERPILAATVNGLLDLNTREEALQAANDNLRAEFEAYRAAHP